MFSRRTLFATAAAPLVLAGQSRKSEMFADALAYERFMGRWSRLLAPPLIDFTQVPDSGRMLDVGSGTGALTFALAERKPRCQFVGIDPSKEYVAYASSQSKVPDRASFETGDAQQLRFADAGFDACLSLLVFNFIPNPGKALQELRRVTKPAGPISAAVWDYGDGMRMLRTFWDAAVTIDPKAERADERHMPLCRKGELAELWRKGGLENVREEPIVIQMRFASFAHFWDPFLLGQGPAGAFVQALASDQKSVLRDVLKRRVSPGSADGPFILPARAWSVRGTVPGSK